MTYNSNDLQLIIDGRPLVGNRTGIGVHTAEIAGRLDLPKVPIIASHAAIEDRSGIEECRFRVDRRRWGLVWQQRDLASVATQEQANVVWGPHGTLPWRLQQPAVVTVHDLTSMTMPLRHRLKTIASFNFFIARSLRQASMIAAVSRRTAEEVMETFALDWKKIEIVPNGVSDFFTPRDEPQDPPFGLQYGRYILNVGTLEPRKGIRDLLNAWQSLAEPRPRLVLTGDSGWGNRELRPLIDELRGKGELLLTGFVDRSTLRELYRGCLFFVYPSRYEGFGLPPLEAMACGAPVIASRAGAIPEVVGDAAILTEPGEAAGLSQSMKHLIDDAVRRKDLRVLGLAQAKKYRWDQSAAKMRELFVEAAIRG